MIRWGGWLWCLVVATICISYMQKTRRLISLSFVPFMPFRLYAYLYLVQMLVLTTALCLAARPGVTDATLNFYNTPLDQFRGFLEAVVILMWMVKIVNELQKFIS